MQGRAKARPFLGGLINCYNFMSKFMEKTAFSVAETAVFIYNKGTEQKGDHHGTISRSFV